MNISEKIKMLRKEKRLTQAMLAESLKVARSTVIAWEGKRCLPEGENLKNIARVLDTTVAFLLEENEDTGRALVVKGPIMPMSNEEQHLKETSPIILKLSEVRYMLDSLCGKPDIDDIHIIDKLLNSCKKISAKLLLDETAAGRDL